MCSFERLPRCAGLPAKITKITGLILRPPMLGEEGEPGWGEAHYIAPVGSVKRDEAAVVCVFPHREFWAGRAPSLHGFLVG